MSTAADVASDEHLRIVNYNSTVLTIERRHDDLMIMRVRPDCGAAPFIAGQYTVLALGYWEPRLEGCQEEGELGAKRQRLVKRAYSISSPMIDENGAAVGVDDTDYFEFYIALVRKAENPPALTPRLFCLEEGDRLFCSNRAHGHYTLHDIHRDTTVIFAGTGTGEAPHNAMAAQLLKTGHRGPIVNATCVRWTKDLGYLSTQRKLEKRYANYRYVSLTTREPENLDSSHPNFVGKRYLQDYFQSGDLEKECGIELDPDNTHVFLCGNPDMIGAPKRAHDPAQRYPEPTGMVEILERRGFTVSHPHNDGNIHYESFW